MNMYERVLDDPEVKAWPPVLVDVGAAGGIPREWRAIAAGSIGIAFEPDVRSREKLQNNNNRHFSKWILAPGLALPTAEPKEAVLYLTRAPQCSSVLRPLHESLGAWAFHDMFKITGEALLPALTLAEALTINGLKHIDWLKCDTQGLDLKIYSSLSDEQQNRVLIAEFEPGIIDAYRGEDHLPEVMSYMKRLPFLLVDMGISKIARLGGTTRTPFFSRWLRRLGHGMPAWSNLRYGRNFSVSADRLSRRDYLVGWLFASVLRHYSYASEIASAGEQRYPEQLWAELKESSERSLRRSLLWQLPRWIAQRVRP